MHLDDTPSVFEAFVDHPCASALLVGSVFAHDQEPAAHVRSVETWRHFRDLVRELEAEGAPLNTHR